MNSKKKYFLRDMTSKKVDVWNVLGYPFNIPPPLPAPKLRTMTSMPLLERTVNYRKKSVNSKWILENNFKKSENYRQNDKDVRPRSFSTGLRDRHNNDKMKLPYDRLQRPRDSFGNRLFIKNNNDRQNPKEDEGCNRRHIGLDYKRTSVEPETDWQTKQQMDEYGLLGGCCRKGNHLNHECCRSEETSQSSYKSGFRSQSLSRPSRDKIRKPLLGILKRSNSKPAVRRRSRSVCFTEKNEEFVFEVEDNDIELGEVAQNNLQTEDVVQLESKMTHEGIEMDYPSVKSMLNEKRIVKHIIAVEKQPYFEKTKPLTSKEENSEKAKPNEPNQLDSKGIIPSERSHGLNELDVGCRLEGNVTNLINEETLKIPDKMTLSNVKPERKFHGFCFDDKSNEMAQLELRTFIIQKENKCEDDCQEFAESYYDILMDEDLHQDNIEGLLDNAAAHINDSFESSHMEVQNDQIIIEKNKTDAIPLSYFTPIDDLHEDDLDLTHIIESSYLNKEPFLKSQEEVFQIETNVALNNVLGLINSNDKSSKCSQYVDNLFDIKKLNRYDSCNTFLLNGEEFDQTQPTQCNQKLFTKITKTCQSFQKSSSIWGVLKNTDLDSKNTKTTKSDKENFHDPPNKEYQDKDGFVTNSTIDPKMKPVRISVRRLKLKMKPLRVSVDKLKLNKNSVKIGLTISSSEDQHKKSNLKTLFKKQETREGCA